MKTPSLRRRVVLWSVGVLAILLLVVGVGVDFTLGAVLKKEQQDRLISVASLARALTGLSDQKIADRLASFPDITATVQPSSGGGLIVGTPQPQGPGDGGPPKAPKDPKAVTDSSVAISEQDGQIVATTTLPDGSALVLRQNTGQIDTALLRFRVIMAVASVAAIALAILLLPLVLRRAMRPLGALTGAARETAAGGRGRRLDPRNPETDLGMAAAQFDAMLEELEGAEARAAQAADRLGRFLSDASHELRTPIAGVSAGAERLIREPLDDEARDRVVVQIVREARRAGRLVDDLLLVSRLGELAVVARTSGLRGLIRAAADRAAEQRGAPAVEVQAIDETVSVDRERIAQVFANLIGNAGNAGASTVRFRSGADGSDGSDGSDATTVAVRISDDGPGIPEVSREAVFERLVRLDPARASAKGGAGLGLPIARGLVEAHGGTLQIVDAAPGDLGGAVFLLRLPRAEHVPDAHPIAEMGGAVASVR